MSIPGAHNVMNALSVIACGDYLKISQDVIKTTLKDFTGAKRRFEFVGKENGINVFEDYAHHPTCLLYTSMRPEEVEGFIVANIN